MFTCAYLIMNLIFITLANKYYSRVINPVTVYSSVWLLAVLIHQSGLIYYYPLSLFTWLVIFLAQIVFSVSCFIGKRYDTEKYVLTEEENEQLKHQLNKYILITLSLASVGVLSSIYNIISIFGTNMLANITNVYAARVSGMEDFQLIPYVGSFIFIALPLSAIYVKRYGFSLWVILTFVMVALNALTSGGRAGIVFSLLMFVFAYLFTDKKEEENQQSTSRKGLYFSAVLLVAMFVVMSSYRTAGNEIEYATDLYYRVFGDNVLVFKIFAYIANPLGVLNEYLKDCTFDFGHNTLLPIYNIIAKFGLMERVEQYQSWYEVPALCNVGTWLRELVEDFTIFGAIPFIMVYALVLNSQYQKAIYRGSISHIVITSMLMMMIAMSFFDWKLRTSSLWIALAFGYYIGNRIQNAVFQKEDD